MSSALTLLQKAPGGEEVEEEEEAEEEEKAEEVAEEQMKEKVERKELLIGNLGTREITKCEVPEN